MITIYTGLIGGGKTTEVTRQSLQYLVKGGEVWSNVKINPCAVVKWAAARCSKGIDCISVHQRYHYIEEPDSLMHRHVKPGSGDRPSLLVIDEATEWFDSYMDSKNASFQEFASFCRQSRKVSVDIIFIVQHLSMAQKRLRVLAEYVYMCRDLQRVKIPGMPFSFAWIPLFCIQQYDTNARFCLRTEVVAKDQLLWDCYQTGQLYRDLGVMKGKGNQDRKAAASNVYSMVWMLTAITWAALGFGIWTSKRDIKKLREEKARAPQVQYVPGVASAASDQEETKRQVVWEKDGRYYHAVTFQGGVTRQGARLILADGDLYETGKVYKYGKCEYVSERLIICQDRGTYHVLVPASDKL